MNMQRFATGDVYYVDFYGHDYVGLRETPKGG